MSKLTLALVYSHDLVKMGLTPDEAGIISQKAYFPELVKLEDEERYQKAKAKLDEIDPPDPKLRAKEPH